MGEQVKYYNVTFNDGQNGAKKTYKIQEGTKIELTNSAFTVDKDCTVDVILPQLASTSVWDANKDGYINKNDITLLERKQEEYCSTDVHPDVYENYVADKIDDALEQSNSQYHVDRDGYSGPKWAYADGNTFRATFANEYSPDRTKKYQQKTFGIVLPE